MVKDIWTQYNGVSVLTGHSIDEKDAAFVKIDKSQPYCKDNVVPVCRHEVYIIRKEMFSWTREQLNNIHFNNHSQKGGLDNM